MSNRSSENNNKVIRDKKVEIFFCKDDVCRNFVNVFYTFHQTNFGFFYLASVFLLHFRKKFRQLSNKGKVVIAKLHITVYFLVRRFFDSQLPPPWRLGETPVLRLFNILTICFWLASCAGNSALAPVDILSQPPSYKITSHTVAVGETLYSIAWRYTIDVNELARHNGISPPYTLYPGQKLNIDLTGVEVVTAPAPTVNRDTVTIRSRNGPKNGPSKESTVGETAPLQWRWPLDGPVVESFSGSGGLNKGIDIGAKKGEPVLAAESGAVVYAGSGLRGYGKLLIIKHNENYLSAYAHNQKLWAAEGDVVKAGQQVAETGSSGTNRYKLHFEIRYNGKPVDPLDYLPRR